MRKECIVEPFLKYQDDGDYSHYGDLIDEECSPFRFSLNGLYLILVTFAVITILAIIVQIRDKNFDNTKKYNEILTFYPLYSIFFGPNLPYDTRFI